MNRELLGSPTAMLREQFETVGDEARLEEYEQWWERTGSPISASIDRAGTPWLKMFNRSGERIDLIQFEPDYGVLLRRGYREGIIWRVFADNDLLPFYRMGYVASFYDPGLYCPYTVSMATAFCLAKYGDGTLREAYLPRLCAQDNSVWQGATWMTEIGGGSDLGRTVETRARQEGDHWLLDGDKYFASNVGAELAIAAARPQGSPDGVRGLALFLVPRRRLDGGLNYQVRRLKNKIATRSVPTGEVELRGAEGYLLGAEEQGIYLILESLNLSRVANSVACVALAQRALYEAAHFASRRQVFGRSLMQQPLFRSQYEQRMEALHANLSLAWEAVRLLREVWQERPPYSPRYHLFRLLAHLAKYQTAEFALEVSQWSMQAHGALGILTEFPVERWFREAMILAIWEGTSHRQILDGIEVMQRKRAHELLFEHLGDSADRVTVEHLHQRIDTLLGLEQEQQEQEAETLFRDLAEFTSQTLLGLPGS